MNDFDVAPEAEGRAPDNWPLPWHCTMSLNCVAVMAVFHLVVHHIAMPLQEWVLCALFHCHCKSGQFSHHCSSGTMIDVLISGSKKANAKLM